jgi:hypothetical protein
MTTISHETPRRTVDFLVPEMWASLAISVMWLAVLFDAVFGPDFVSTSGGGSGDSTTIPSAVFVAVFAWLASVAVARYAFRRRSDG